MTQLEEEQEIMMYLSDMLMEIYVVESACLRTRKLADLKGEAAAAVQTLATRLYLHDATERIACAGRQALQSFAEGDDLRLMMLGLKRFTKADTFNPTAARRQLEGALA